jgi:hypothetical protein
MEEQFRPKETVGGSSPSRGTPLRPSKVLIRPIFRAFRRIENRGLPTFCPHCSTMSPVEITRTVICACIVNAPTHAVSKRSTLGVPMYTLLTVIRKKPEVSTERFREFMENEYGPTYAGLSQTRSYVQYYLDDLATDGAEDPIDAIVQIAFDSQDEMRIALQADSYKVAHTLREAYMRETSSGIHSAAVSKIVTLV